VRSFYGVRFAFWTRNRTPSWLVATGGRGHPVRTFLTGVVLSFFSIAALSTLLGLLGLLVTRVLVLLHRHRSSCSA